MTSITLTNYRRNYRGDWGHQLSGGKRKEKLGSCSITWVVYATNRINPANTS